MTLMRPTPPSPPLAGRRLDVHAKITRALGEGRREGGQVRRSEEKEKDRRELPGCLKRNGPDHLRSDRTGTQICEDVSGKAGMPECSVVEEQGTNETLDSGIIEADSSFTSMAQATPLSQPEPFSFWICPST